MLPGTEHSGDPEPIQPLTANAIVSLLEDMSEQGNPLTEEEKDYKKFTLKDNYFQFLTAARERIQNYSYLDPVTLEEWEVTVYVKKNKIGNTICAGVTLDNCADEAAEEMTFGFNNRLHDGVTTLVPNSWYEEIEGVSLLQILEDAELLDDLEWEDFEEADSLG